MIQIGCGSSFFCSSSMIGNCQILDGKLVNLQLIEKNAGNGNSLMMENDRILMAICDWFRVKICHY